MLSVYSYAQGCSDAGVCSVGALGLAQYKYEKLPIEKVTLDVIEVEDTEVLGADFDPKRKSTSKNETFTENVSIKSDTIIAKQIDNNIVYNVDSLKKNSNVIKRLSANKPKLIITNLLSYGEGDNKTSNLTNSLELNYQLSNKIYSQLKVPYTYISGNLGSVSGVGDLTFSFSYTALNKIKKSVNVVAGIKIPTSSSNSDINNKPLPMAYQTSLGTVDGLFGVNYRLSKWDFTLAYQHSFNQNKNQYLHTFSLENDYNSYFESKNLKRADDAVFRINKSFLFKNATLTSGLLFIYHLQNDTYENLLGTRVESKGSQGLTLNLNAAVIFPISRKVDFTFIYARPLKIRDARPDGLTRSFVLIGGLRFAIK